MCSRAVRAMAATDDAEGARLFEETRARVSGVLAAIRELPERRGLVEALLREAAVAGAAAAAAPAAVGGKKDVILVKEKLMREAGKALGTVEPATPARLRHELLERGRRDLMKRACKVQKGRIAAAHPEDLDFIREVVMALTESRSGDEQDSTGSVSDKVLVRTATASEDEPGTSVDSMEGEADEGSKAPELSTNIRNIVLETVGEIGSKNEDMGINKARVFGLEVGEDTSNNTCKMDPESLIISCRKR